uniref:Odorant receptor n=1 Tax=Calliphora stygia TaxID=145453 RepID=A0A068F5J7_CALSG|nr:odorant receptor [Calliphora stygia]
MAGKYSERFFNIFYLTRRFSELCGADVIKNDYKICWKTGAIFLLINFAIAFTFYTNYVEVIVNGNYYNLLKSASILGTGLQGYTKLINILLQQKSLRFLYQEITEIYEIYELKSTAYKDCLRYSITLVKKLLSTLLTLIVITTLIIIGIPVFMLIFLDTRIEIMPFKIPYIDIETDIGYYVTFVVHTISVFFGGFGNFVIDSWLFIFAAHVPLIKNILKCKFDELDKILEANPKDVEKSRAPLKDIFEWHQKYMLFCKIIKEAFFWVIFVQVGTEFFGIISTIVCIFLGIWPPAPAYLLYLFAMFYSYCSLGNIVEVSNDDVTLIIYDSCWYNLTASEQKMVLIMLRESQQATGISIGGVSPLSMSTALQLTKTVYTLSMMLKEFLN